MNASRRNDPVVAPESADQNTPLDGHWWRSARPTTTLFSSLLGDLLPQAIARLNDRYKSAKAAAQSWGKNDEMAAVSLMQEKLKEVADAAKVDQWHLNSAVHYNA